MILLLTVFMCANILPVQAAQEADPGNNPLEQSTPSPDEQQVHKYITNLNYYLGNIDEIGSQTINAVKKLQDHYSLTEDGIVVANTANELIDQADPGPPDDSFTPSRGSRSRAALIVSSQDLECLARTVYGEARGESFEGQVAVAAVVLNRVESGQFGKGIPGVIFQPRAFTAVCDGQYYLQPNASSYEAAGAALNGWDPTNGAVYYWNPVTATSRWVRTRTITGRIGNHVFAI